MTNVHHTFNLCHKFSIGLMSGDSAGVLHQYTPLLVKKSLAAFEVCLGSLFAINRWPSGYTDCIKGMIQDFNVKGLIHDTLKDTYPCASSLTDSSPYIP